MKLLPRLPEPLDHWDNQRVSMLFAKIWKIEHWEALRPNLPGFGRLTGPPVLDPLARKERLEELVKELGEVFNDAADQADTFYGVVVEQLHLISLQLRLQLVFLALRVCFHLTNVHVQYMAYTYACAFTK